MTDYGIEATKDPKDPFSRIHKGIEKLAQLVEKAILTTRGTDDWNPDMGCAIKSFIGMGFRSLDEVARLVDGEIGRVQEQIIRLQMKEIGDGFFIPEDELLRSLTLVDVSRAEGGIMITYELENQEGQTLERSIIPSQGD